MISGALVSQLAHADGCVRGEPIPLFASDKGQVIGHRFTAISEHEAKEKFRLATATKVEIAHGGCEYVVLTFRVESSKLFAAAYSPAFAHQETGRFFHQLKGLPPEITFDLTKAAASLLNASRHKKPPAFAHEIDIPGNGVPPLRAGVHDYRYWA